MTTATRGSNAIDLQRQYYASSANAYDDLHKEEMRPGLDLFAWLLRTKGCRSVLDVGSGTGNVVVRLRQEGFEVRGVEPSEPLIARAIEKGLSASDILKGEGQAIPFADKSFDAVCEFGVLHHVADPGPVVAEMLRVARRMVVICDANRFGQGPAALKLLKLLLHAMGLWKLADWLRTGGRGYMESEGDGIFYSYSAYDSMDQLKAWADSIIVLPSSDRHRSASWFQPLFTSPGVLVAAVRHEDS